MATLDEAAFQRVVEAGRALLKRERVGALPNALPAGWGQHSKP